MAAGQAVLIGAKLCRNENRPFHDPAAPFDFETRKLEGIREHMELNDPH